MDDQERARLPASSPMLKTCQLARRVRKVHDRIGPAGILKLRTANSDFIRHVVIVRCLYDIDVVANDRIES